MKGEDHQSSPFLYPLKGSLSAMAITIWTTALSFRLKVNRKGEIIDTPLSIMEFTNKLTQWLWDNKNRRQVLGNEYFKYDSKNEMCYFPKFELDNFKEFLTRRHVKFDIQHLPGEEGRHTNFMMLPHIGYKNDKQKNAIEFLTNNDSGPLRGLALQTGLGKLQPLHSKILTPDGWDIMGNMKVGTKVVAWDGTTSTVVGVYPQGVKDIYQITFEDGRKTECGLEHLWRVYYVQWKEKWRVITTEQIIQYLTQPTYRARMGIQLPLPPIVPDVDLPIDPYALGVLLGDGTITQQSIHVCKPDQFVKDELDKVLYPYYRTSPWHADEKSYTISKLNAEKSLHFVLEDLGSKGCVSHTKFIPDVYMNASASQKLALLQGLMDTDGTVNITVGRNQTEKIKGKGGTLSYCSTSKQMAEQVQYLVRSLGGLARISIRNPFFTYKGERKEGKRAYQVNIRFSNPTTLFRLPRKKERTSDDYQYADRLRARIVSVELVGKAEAQCIEIDHPDHLYITDNYIVTHNTVSTIWALQRLHRRAMITMTSRLEQWVKEIVAYTTLEEDDIYVIQGVGSLTKLFTLIDQDLKPKIILSSTKTIQLYLQYGPTYQHLPHPTEMCEKLGIGICAIDEAHEWFYTNFLIGMLLNPAIFIPITATFAANEPFTKKVFDQFFPKNIQFTGGEYEKYVEVYAYEYRSGGFLIKPYTYSGPRGYSSQIFEKWLMGRGRKFLDPLIQDAIIPIVREHYINLAEEGEKFLFLCSSKALCDHLEGVFRRVFKDKTVSVFYSGMPTTVLERYDMILSTPGSAGTGRDVKKLRTCFVFESVESETRNLQFIGRLRGPPSMMNTPVFTYLYITAIPSHNRVASARALLYGPRSVKFIHRSLS
jgi:hypothetical protein